MVKIEKANKKETKTFGEPEWHKMDLLHYGHDIEWKEKKFRFKAVENGRILGTVSGRYECGVVYVGTIIVAEKSRGKGIGKMLMDKVEEFAKGMGAHKIWLDTGSNWPAGKFYESLGFERTANLPNHYFQKDFVIYSKII
jgi:ribosomal protein S18 acetylase RimI-like enzyme